MLRACVVVGSRLGEANLGEMGETMKTVDEEFILPRPLNTFSEYERRQIESAMREIAQVYADQISRLCATQVPKYLITKDGMLEKVWDAPIQRVIDRMNELCREEIRMMLKRYER